MPRQALSIAKSPGITLDRRFSVAVQVLDHLRNEIVNTSLAPGTPLSEHALSQRFGVSRTPVREALSRLAEEGLVQIVPQVGTYVKRISLAKVYEAQFIREALECATARRAAATRPQWQDTVPLDRIINDQQRAADAGDHTAFFVSDEEFHSAIALASGFPRVWTVASSEKLQLDRVRMLDVSQRNNLDLVTQHNAIVSALKAQDPVAAEQAMRAHLRDVFERLAPLIAENHAYFDDLEAKLPQLETTV
jgi:DNA-binding GntR family transcriptional regulator